MKTPFHPLVFYVSFVLLSVGMVFGYAKFERENREIISIMQALVIAGQRDLAMTQAELEEFRMQSEELARAKELEIIAQEERLQELSGRLATLQSAPSATNTTDIVNEWRSSVFKIVCSFTDGVTGRRFVQSGSGVGLNLQDGAIFMTNKHVLVRDNRSAIENCIISADGVTGFELPLTNMRLDTEFDFAFVVFGTRQAVFNKMLSPGTICSASAVAQGANIVILGYPITGVRNSVTVTEGIIAGTEQNYYVTSAKIEQGNSGGAAILTSRSCILGLPTFAQVGQVESLGRILKLENLIDL